jgi:hypothetical protein
MNIQNKSKKIAITFIFLFVLLIFIGLFCVYEYLSGAVSTMFSKRYRESKIYINNHENEIITILSTGIDSAALCYHDKKTNCSEDNRYFVYKTLKNTEALRDFPSTYFVRVKDGIMQKLFLSGEYKEDPFYSICSWKVKYLLSEVKSNDSIYCSYFFIPQTVLGDLPSDGGTENIIRIDDGESVYGAIVRLYGQ